ncbi:MAG: glycosyltransferase family 4 protein [Pseudomonadota bacterium]
MSRNYLHYARTLMHSVEAFAPGASRVVGLCDERGSVEFSAENFDILDMRSLDIPEIDKFIFRYTILELNTAIKPYVITALFQQGFDKVIYFDPDIRLFRSLDSMIALLDEHQMLLTPHLTGPLDDNRLPSELNILVSGSYNLGYIGLRNTPDMQRFTRWWEQKLYTDCVVDLERGLFVDQKWMDLAPGMYPGVHIERSPGWNVAYWNLKHRTLTEDATGIQVNGEPLLFFHFSGFSGTVKTLSKHQDRYSKQSAGPVVEKLCVDYARCLEDNGQTEALRLPYHYGRFADGTLIPDFARYIYRDDYDWESSQDNPYEAKGCANYLEYLNEPIELGGRRIPWITRIAYKLYRARPDLQEAFPDLRGAYGKRFADWYVQSAAEQAGFEDHFIAPVREALRALGTADTEGSLPQRARRRFNGLLYRAAWRYRHLVRPFIPPSLRHRVHVRLVDSVARQTAESAETAESAARSGVNPDLPWGINLYGYLQAESGIGQSARASIHSILAADIPLSAIDFREGNVSRMEAEIPSGLTTEPRYNTNLFHINADETVNALRHLGEDVLRGHYNIGYWAWELPEFPDRWLPAIALLDEIWVPSEFCRDAIAAKADIPVTCLPHSVIAPATPAVADRSKFGLPPEGLLFLTMYDALSVPERKNPEGAIEAFLRSKRERELNAHLIIKVSNLDQSPDHGDALRGLVDAEPTLHLLEGYLTRRDIEQLIATADVFLSLHRSEGFGLGLAEAMLQGKVAIATAWSGNLEFMTSANSMLVRSEPTSIQRSIGPYDAGQHWAEPDLDHAAELINRLDSDTNLAHTLGEAASVTLHRDFSPAAIGQRIAERLSAIEGNQRAVG